MGNEKSVHSLLPPLRLESVPLYLASVRRHLNITSVKFYHLSDCLKTNYIFRGTPLGYLLSEVRPWAEFRKPAVQIPS